MPSIIDPQTIHVDELPPIWSPIQWELNEKEEWDDERLTFGPYRPMKLIGVERERDYLRLVYNCGDLGHWEFVIEPEKVTIERI